MDDKEFEEIMQKYVASTSRGKETDFKKLRQLQSQQQTPQKRKSFKPKYALVGVLCSIIVVLAVVLPATLLTKDSGTNTDIVYSNMEDINVSNVDSISDLINNNINARFLSIDNLSAIALLSSNKHTSILGANIIVDNVNSNLNNVKNFIIKKQYVINDLSAYFDFPKIIVWKEYTVRYATVLDTDNNCMKYQIYFTDGSYDYFLDVTGKIDMDITEILDVLYGE